MLDAAFIENTCDKYLTDDVTGKKTLSGLAEHLNVSYSTLNRTERNAYDSSGKKYGLKKVSWNRKIDTGCFPKVTDAMQQIRKKRSYRGKSYSNGWN